MSDYVKTNKATQRKIDQIEAKIEKLKKQQRAVEREIDQLRCGLMPIKPGDTIWWESGSRTKRGRVISVRCDYRDNYELRVHVVNKAGNTIGYATVNTRQNPALEPPQ